MSETKLAKIFMSNLSDTNSSGGSGFIEPKNKRYSPKPEKLKPKEFEHLKI